VFAHALRREEEVPVELESAQGVDDASVSAFSAVLAREEFREELDRLSFSRWRWGARQDLRLRSLKCHEHDRCTFEIALKTPNGWHSVIGKVFVQDRVDVFEALDGVRRAGFGPEAEFSIPQPYAYLASLRVLLEEKIEGPSAKEMFLTGGPREQISAAERCARWLARFHALAPRWGRVVEISKELSDIRNWTDVLARLEEPLAGKARLLSRKLIAAAPSLGAVESCAGHGSYIPEHVILANGRTATIDLDDYDVGDPTRDVAWFLVGVERVARNHLGSLDALDAAAGMFLRTYASFGRNEVLARLPFYMAEQYLHGAKRDARNKPPGWPNKVGVMLDRGLRALDKGPDQRAHLADNTVREP